MKSALLNLMVGAVIKAGRNLARAFVDIEMSNNKGEREQKIMDGAKANAKKDLEWSAKKIRKGRDTVWHICELDGEINFLNSIPLWAVGLALEQNGELIATAIYNPLSEELFTAEKRRGAFLNEKRIKTSTRKTLEGAIVAGKNYTTGSKLLDTAWTAAGRIDAYKGKSQLEALLLLRESGTKTTSISQKESIYKSKTLLAANEKLHEQLQKILN